MHTFLSSCTISLYLDQGILLTCSVQSLHVHSYNCFEGLHTPPLLSQLPATEEDLYQLSLSSHFFILTLFAFF